MINRRTMICGSMAPILLGSTPPLRAAPAKKDPCNGARSIIPSRSTGTGYAGGRLGVELTTPYFGDMISAIHRDTAAVRVAPNQAPFALEALRVPSRISGSQQPASGLFNENPLDYTIQEIYLSYRTAPRGSFSVPAAMYETASFAGTRLLGAFGAGYTVGTGIQKAWEYLSPDSWDSFSNFIGSNVDGFARAVESALGGISYASATRSMRIQIGALEETLWNGFARPGMASWFSSGGDFDVTAAWRDKLFDSCR